MMVYRLSDYANRVKIKNKNWFQEDTTKQEENLNENNGKTGGI